MSSKTQAHNFINKFEHEFAPGLKLTNLTGYSAVDRFNRTRPVQIQRLSTTTSHGRTCGMRPSAAIGWRTPGTPLTTADTPLNNIWIANTQPLPEPDQQQLLSNVTDLNAKFNTGRLQHNILVGMEWSREDREQFRTNFIDTYRDQRRQSKSLCLRARSPRHRRRRFPTPTAVGFYAQDQMKVTEWLELLGGIRYDIFTANAQTYSFSVLPADRAHPGSPPPTCIPMSIS